MRCTISKETMVYVCDIDGADEILRLECPLGEVLEKIGVDNMPYLGYVVNIHDPYTRLFTIHGRNVTPGDFYHQIDNFNELPVLLDENNKYRLTYNKQWCVEGYCEFIGMPEAAGILKKKI